MKKNLLVFVLTVVFMLVMAGCGSKPTLSEWVESGDAADNVEQMNTAYAEDGTGLHIKLSAEGEDVLVFSYIFEEYQLTTESGQNGMNMELANLLSYLSTSVDVNPIFEDCKEATGITLKYIRVQCVNADGTVIDSREHYYTK